MCMQLLLRVPDSIWEGFSENIAKPGVLYYGHGVRESPMPDSRRDLTRQTHDCGPPHRVICPLHAASGLHRAPAHAALLPLHLTPVHLSACVPGCHSSQIVDELRIAGRQAFRRPGREPRHAKASAPEPHPRHQRQRVCLSRHRLAYSCVTPWPASGVAQCDL